jgi:hypothetical protein
LEHIPTKHKIFDMNHAGCILAWDYFFGTTSKPTPQFLYYIEDRELCVWKLTKSKEICAAIDLYPQTFIAWSKFYNQGEAILMYRQRIIDDVVVNSTGGSTNVSRINNVELILKFQDELAEEQVQIGRNWNIIGYKEGLGGLAFNN